MPHSNSDVILPEEKQENRSLQQDFLVVCFLGGVYFLKTHKERTAQIKGWFSGRLFLYFSVTLEVKSVRYEVWPTSKLGLGDHSYLSFNLPMVSSLKCKKRKCLDLKLFFLKKNVIKNIQGINCKVCKA